MISQVPVARYSGFNQSCRQPQRVGCQPSQISGHFVVWWLLIHISLLSTASCQIDAKSRFAGSEKNMTACENELGAEDAYYFFCLN
jgi:hypothetical protein